jgi:polar amino acid transport system substrate-binding protein
MQDLVAGRIDITILDPPLMQYAISQHPDWKLHQLPVDPDPKYPVMSTKYNVIFGINKNEPELAAAVNDAIKEMWAQCLNVKAMAKYGMGDKAWFVPPEKNPRIGVDRPADYVSPTADHCFK